MWLDDFDESLADEIRHDDRAREEAEKNIEPPDQTEWFTYEVGSLAHQDTAQKMATVLQEAMSNSWLQPEFIVAPFNGSWVLSVQSSHPDAEADLVEHMLFAVAYVAAKRF